MKKYLWSWAIAGAAVPLLLGAISHFLMPPPPEWNPWEKPKMSTAERRFQAAVTFLYPAIFVEEVLALVVTDSGGNSGAGFTGAVLLAVSLLLNAGYYVVFGLLTWYIASSLRTMFKKRAPS